MILSLEVNQNLFWKWNGTDNRWFVTKKPNLNMVNLSITKYSLSIFFIRYSFLIFIRLLLIAYTIWLLQYLFCLLVLTVILLWSYVILKRIQARREPLTSVIISFHTSPPFYRVISSCFVPKIQSKYIYDAIVVSCVQRISKFP